MGCAPDLRRPGDGINDIIAAIDAHEKAHAESAGAIDFVQVRHEEQAAFMACAHAKFTAELGVGLATRAPGAIHFTQSVKGVIAGMFPHRTSKRETADHHPT